MHPRFQYNLARCGIERALALLGEKWTLLVLREAFYGLRRFDDFARALGCGRAVLSTRIKTLVRAGVLEAKAYNEPGRRVRSEYHMTPKGKDLFPVIVALSQWHDRWAPPPGGPLALVVDRHSRKPVAVIMTCDRRPGLTFDDTEFEINAPKKRTHRKQA